MTDEPKQPVRPRPPKGLAVAGKALWEAIHADLAKDLELDKRDLDTLTEACSMADTIAELQESVDSEGAIIAGRQGPRVHPAVMEIRQLRLTKMRLLAAVEMEDRSTRSPASRRAGEAANVRWSLERARRGAA